MAISMLILATAIAVAGAWIGVVLGGIQRRHLELLVHVATGALLGITAFDILPEAKHVLSWPVFAISAVAGYGLLWGVGHYVFHVCPSCAIAHADAENDLKRRGSLILLAGALGIHCVLDGLAIIAGAHLSAVAEWGAILGVGLHKLPEGAALGLLLICAKFDRWRSLRIAGGIESLTIAGGLAGLLFVTAPTPSAVGVVFAFVGGGFTYLVCNALGGAFTHQMQISRVKGIAIGTVSFVATGGLIWLACQM